MKTGFIALILTLVLASSAMAADWSFQLGAPLAPYAPAPVPPVTPIYPYPYGYSYFYLTPPQPYFGFSYDKRSRGRDSCPPAHRDNHRSHDHRGGGRGRR